MEYNTLYNTQILASELYVINVSFIKAVSHKLVFNQTENIIASILWKIRESH